MTDSFARFVVLSIDAQGYGKAHDQGQTAIQDELLDVLATAAAAAGLDRRTWHRQGKGDEELALIAASDPDTERLRPADYRQVSVSEKELVDQAWLRVPGVDVHRLRITQDPVTGNGTTPTKDAAPPGRDMPAARHGGSAVVNEFTAPVDARHGVIGIRNAPVIRKGQP